MHIRKITVKTAQIDQCLLGILCAALEDLWNTVWDLVTGGEKAA